MVKTFKCVKPQKRNQEYEKIFYQMVFCKQYKKSFFKNFEIQMDSFKRDTMKNNVLYFSSGTSIIYQSSLSTLS